jgi:hypothetical protein
MEKKYANLRQIQSGSRSQLKQEMKKIKERLYLASRIALDLQ